MPNDEDTLAHPEQPRFLLSAWMWAVALFVFFGVIVAIAFSAMPRGSTYEQDRARARAEKLKTAEGEWSKTMSSYGWVDKAKGLARIPIARAERTPGEEAGPGGTDRDSTSGRSAGDRRRRTAANQSANGRAAGDLADAATDFAGRSKFRDPGSAGRCGESARRPPRHPTRRFRDPGRRAEFADRSSAGFTRSHSGAAPDRHSHPGATETSNVTRGFRHAACRSMSWNDFLDKMRRYDQNAAVIFDEEEPIGRPTDMVMPRRRWFNRRQRKDAPANSKAASKHS